MLDSNLVQLQERVLKHSVLVAPVLATQVVQPLVLVKQVVHNSNEDSHADRVRPDQDHSNNIRPSIVRVHEDGLGRSLHDTAAGAGQPPEQGEDGSEDVHDEDGADELPRGPGLAAAGDEDEPVLREGDLEEEDLLDRAEVLDDAAVLEEHCCPDDPGCDG